MAQSKAKLGSPAPACYHTSMTFTLTRFVLLLALGISWGTLGGCGSMNSGRTQKAAPKVNANDPMMGQNYLKSRHQQQR